MKNTHHAQQVIEYLLLFAGVVITILGVSSVVGNKTSGILGDTFDDFSDDQVYTYAWTPGDCGPCSDPCGGCCTEAQADDPLFEPPIQNCGYLCERNDGTVVADGNCSDQGEKPGDAEKGCLINYCPINCTWEDWPCNVDPSLPECNVCEPVCGEDRRRVEYRTIVQEAKYGGQPCNPDDGLRTFEGPPECPDVECQGECGDGIINLIPGGGGASEECDNLNFGGLSCASLEIETSAGVPLNGNGELSCTPGCTIDFNKCHTEVRGPWLDDACAAAASPSCMNGQMGQDQVVHTETVDGDFISDEPADNTRCIERAECSYACAIAHGHTSWCPDHDQGLTSDDYPVTYVNQGACAAGVPCQAQCLSPLISNGTDCVCPTAGEVFCMADNACHECCTNSDCPSTTQDSPIQRLSQYRCYLYNSGGGFIGTYTIGVANVTLTGQTQSWFGVTLLGASAIHSGTAYGAWCWEHAYEWGYYLDGQWIVTSKNDTITQEYICN